MSYSVELNFDQTAERRVRFLWREVATRRLCSLMEDVGARPHLSLAVFDSVPIDALGEAIERLAERTSPLPLQLKAVGVFPGPENAVYLAPAVTPELLQLHRAFFEVIEPLALQPWGHYLPDRWMPHCTVAYEMPDSHIGPVVDVCRNGDALGPAEIVDVTLVEFRPVRTLRKHALRAS